MSHIVTIATKLRDPVAIKAACRRLGLAAPQQGTFKLFAGHEASGWAVRLPDWRYPVVCDTTTGAVNCASPATRTIAISTSAAGGPADG